MRPLILFATVALAAAAGCSSDPQVVCEGSTPTCDARGYYPLCGDPGTNDAVDEVDGLFCVNRANCTPSSGDFCLDYIGPAVEVAPACSGGEPAACSDGQQPICVYLPGCRGGEFEP